MEAWRRLGYLTAMGIQTWALRAPATEASIPDAATQAAPDSVPPSRAVTADGVSVVEDGAMAAERTPSLPQREVDNAAGIATSSGEGDREEGRPGTEGSMAIQHMDWDALQAKVAGCRACGLCETRTQTVFGIGSRAAELMIIGEAPGADEDRAGEPFVGRAGQLLNRMLAAIGLAREQVYIANVLKCRPPGNRDPKPEEALQCQGYLMRQVALIQPRLILSVGRVSAQQLLRTDTPVGRLRGRWFEEGVGGIPLRVTYHPAYLLRSPEQKAKAWEDLSEVRRRLDAGTSGLARVLSGEDGVARDSLDLAPF